MNNALRCGFMWTIETVRDGEVIAVERVRNLVPGEGIAHILNTVMRGGAQIGSWYVGLFEGNYTPTAADTMATFPGLATEATAYDEATRPAWNESAPVGGTIDNAASRAEFTFNATKTIYGGFIASSASKGSTAGVLLSAVRFGSPKAAVDDTVLRVTAGFTLVSA